MHWYGWVALLLFTGAYTYIALHYYVRRHYLSPEDRKREDEEITRELSIW